jgi:class 3 adenylate cyclase
MVCFANDIMIKMNVLVKELKVSLGPDTGGLSQSLRIGIHLGPITAVVSHGQLCRFQQLGDTMNTTTRIERSSQSRKIHL